MLNSSKRLMATRIIFTLFFPVLFQVYKVRTQPLVKY